MKTSTRLTRAIAPVVLLASFAVPTGIAAAGDVADGTAQRGPR